MAADCLTMAVEVLSPPPLLAGLAEEAAAREGPAQGAAARVGLEKGAAGTAMVAAALGEMAKGAAAEGPVAAVLRNTQELAWCHFVRRQSNTHWTP